jgi:hypothetical protein
MEWILVVWVYAVASSDEELKRRILSFFHLDREEDLKKFVQREDERKYNSLCKKRPNRRLNFFAKRGDLRNVKIAIKEGANNWDRGLGGSAETGTGTWQWQGQSVVVIKISSNSSLRRELVTGTMA